MKKLVFCILVSLVIGSCTTSPMQILDPTDYVSVRNVFSSTDMSVFGGFVDKIPVNRLVDIYGEPDSIYDAYESTNERGYDIYEYSIEGGQLDCYVENITNNQMKNVEFIYYEPDVNIDLDNFVLDKGLLQHIKEKKCNVYYIADTFGNFIRKRVSTKDRTKILNIAYNDCTLLTMKNQTIKEMTNEIKEALPFELSDIGLLKGVNYSNNCLTLNIDVNELNDESIISMLKHTPSLIEDIAIFIMCEGGFFPFLDDVLLEKNASIKFDLVGKKSNLRITKALSSDELRKISSHQLSNERNMLSRININRCFVPRELNYWIEGNGIYLDKDTITMSWILTLSDSESDQIQANYEQWAIGLLANIDNPDAKYVYLAYKCDYYIKYCCKIDGNDTELVALWSPDDLFWFLSNMK